MPRAVIFGCEGAALTAAEHAFFAAADPIGFILFARNCVAPEQLAALCQSLRASVGRPDAPILIDQEGGRVARLKPPHWPAFPAAASFGALAQHDPSGAVEAVGLAYRLMGAMLAEAGIDIDCAPVLDLAEPGAHAAIGDRAFSGDPATVVSLGRAAVAGLLGAGVLPVVKHLPGHGRALVDSHDQTPRVGASRVELEARDFIPFRALNDAPCGIVAHVVYEALDPRAPASVSGRGLEVIRHAIGFRGVLLSDDIGMQALAGSPAERAQATLAAGCDIALHCNGRLDEMRAVAASVGPLTEAASARLRRARDAVPPAAPFDAGAAHARLATLLCDAAQGGT
ncbi:MAG: beta-N-acetylhexosaminidase [Alphaproteobacteria bacterium]|nr:beta-N-acetylhexosaminidase [Alphaproteobacteria bacterium]